MITKTNLSQLRVMDFLQVLNLIDAYMQQENLVELKLEEPHLKFKTAITKLDQSLKKVSTKLDTANMRKADKLRNDVLVGLRAVLSGFVRSPFNNQSNAASELLSILNKHGKSVQKLALREKSAVVNSLIQSFQNTDADEFLQLLGINDWVTILKERNAAFEAVYVERSKDQSTIEVGKVKFSRIEAQKAFDYLAKSINSHAFISGEEAYKSIAVKIDNQVTKALSDVKRRKSLALKAKETKEMKYTTIVNG